MISLRGIFALTWLEIKIFLREPGGAIFTLFVPVIAFIGAGRLLGGRLSRPQPDNVVLVEGGIPALVCVLIVIGAVMSLITIISIYREGGILKRLRATPLRPYTILAAHVLVKLVFTSVTMSVMVLAGKRYFAVGAGVPVFSFAMALLLCTWSILSVGFVVASLVPTARFAQPIGALVLYPMVALSGLFISPDSLPPRLQLVTKFLPFTYVVSLLEGIWRAEPWSAHLTDVAVLVVVFAACTAISARTFRWE